MHEFSLYSQVASTRHMQVLNILAGVTASQPINISEQCLVYQQLKPDTVVAARKAPIKPANKDRDLLFVKLVRTTNSGEEPGKWRLRTEALPDAAAKTVTSRLVTEKLLEDTELEQFRPESTRYKFVSQYITSGVRFVNHNTIIRLTRLFASSVPAGADILGVPSPAVENANLLDPSGTYTLEVCVRVEDGGISGLRDRAVKELESFKKELDGAVDLKVPDRLSMDPRVR